MLYNVQVNIKIEPVEGDSRRYRYLFSLVKEYTGSAVPLQRSSVEVVKPTALLAQRNNSSKVADLAMNSHTFCKAFPWHFIMNEKLELLQMGEALFIILKWYAYIFIICFFLGRGFSKLYKLHMAEHGCEATTYFDFKRPKGLTMKFRDIARRTYTPFLIGLKSPPNISEFPAKVNIMSFDH